MIEALVTNFKTYSVEYKDQSLEQLALFEKISKYKIDSVTE